MPDCKRKATELHHIRRIGSNLDGAANALAMCSECHQATYSYGRDLPKGVGRPPEFSEETRIAVMKRANNMCECTSPEGCH